MALAGPADADRVEHGRFDDDLGRPLLDLASRAAHHAGDGEDPGGIGDDQGVWVEVADHVVERLESLTAAGRPDHDPPVADGRRVERVDRLAGSIMT